MTTTTITNPTQPQTTAEARAAATIAAESNALPPRSDTPATPVYSREDTMTEQEKNPRGDPVADLVEPTERAEVMTIAPREPYPTGSPQNPTFAEINGWPKPE